MPRDLSDPAQVKEQGRKDRDARRMYLADLKEVLDTAAGRRVWWSFLKHCDRISFHQSGSLMCFNEGERNISLTMKADAVEAGTENYLLMEAEAIKRNNEVNDDGK